MASQYGWRRVMFRAGIWQIVYRTWMNLHVTGWENVPGEGPVIMMGNHINAVDPLVMVSFFPDRDIVPLAKTEAFDQPVQRYFVRHWGAIRVDRGKADIGAFRRAINELEQGRVVMLYAEGTRSKTGLIQGQEGSVYLAARSDALVVPVAISGSHRFPYTWWEEFRRTDVYVAFGRPFRFRWQGRRLPRDHFRQMTDEAMYRIAALLPADWRGVYSDMSQATQEFLDFDVDWKPPVTRLPARVVGTS